MRSSCGKLNGNGNGNQYFGAVLAKLDGVDTDSTVSELSKDFGGVGYEKQNSSAVRSKYLEHTSLEFATEVTENGGYGCFYFCEEGNKSAGVFDIKGY